MSRMLTYAELAEERRREAMGKPIVVIRMTQEQYDQALSDGNDVEGADLVAGVRSGQIEIGETS